jgi:hypothetical protein
MGIFNNSGDLYSGTSVAWGFSNFSKRIVGHNRISLVAFFIDSDDLLLYWSKYQTNNKIKK